MSSSSLSFGEFLSEYVGQRSLDAVVYKRLAPAGQRRLSALLRLTERQFAEFITSLLNIGGPIDAGIRRESLRVINETLTLSGLRSPATLEDLLWEIHQTPPGERLKLIKLIEGFYEVRVANSLTNGAYVVVGDDEIVRVDETLELIDRLQNRSFVAPRTRYTALNKETYWLTNLAHVLPVPRPRRYRYPYPELINYQEEFDGWDPLFSVSWAELDPTRYEALLWAIDTQQPLLAGHAPAAVINGIFNPGTMPVLERLIRDYEHLVRVPGDRAQTERRFYLGPRTNRPLIAPPMPKLPPDPWPRAARDGDRTDEEREEQEWFEFFRTRSSGDIDRRSGVGKDSKPWVADHATFSGSGFHIDLIVRRSLTMNAEYTGGRIMVGPEAEVSYGIGTHVHDRMHNRRVRNDNLSVTRYDSWTALGRALRAIDIGSQGRTSIPFWKPEDAWR